MRTRRGVPGEAGSALPMSAMDQPARLVFIGAPGSGKSTVVNRVVASWLDEARASSRASLLPSVVERETLTRSRPRAETSTMEKRVREELSDACLSPDGRRAIAAVEAQAESFPDAVLPRLPTLATVEVRDAPPDADFHVRITATYADERELEALVSKARLAFGLSAGPASRARRTRASRDREDDASSSSSFPRGARRRSTKTTRPTRAGDVRDAVGPPRLSAFERARVASVLGCAVVDDTMLATALRNRDRPYLPARFRDFLGSERRVDFRGPNAAASLAAARLWLVRVAGSSASRPGCLALDAPITIEVPMKPNGAHAPIVLVDTPGVDDTATELARAAAERALSREGARREKRNRSRCETRLCVVDAAVVVSDGAPGPNAALERALRRARTLDHAVSDPGGPALALLWPLDRLGVREADAERYAAESAAAARAGADGCVARGEEDASISVSHAISHEAQSPLRDHAVSASTCDRGWMWHLERARARAAGNAEGNVPADVATWHGAVLDSTREDAAALARFVDGLASAAVRRRALRARRGTAREADGHSTAIGTNARDATGTRASEPGEDVGFRDDGAGGAKTKRNALRDDARAPPSSSSAGKNPFAFASPPEDPTRARGVGLHAGSGGDGDASRDPERARFARVSEPKRGATRARTKPVPDAAPRRNRNRDGEENENARAAKRVRFAPSPPNVHARRTEGQTEGPSVSFALRPPHRKRRKPLLDIAGNSRRGDATRSEGAPRGSAAAAAKKSPRFKFE